MDFRDTLNAQQAQALAIAEGPLLILAGAGSGKTKTLTHRIAYLIADHGVWPDEILAVTFTNKAAREMRERLSQMLGRDNTRQFMPWMGTFHGICVRLLRVDGRSIGVASNFVIYDDDDRTRLVKQAMKDCSVTDKQIKPRQVVATISKAKNDLQTADDYALSASLPYQQTVAKVYARYEALRQAASALDFDDILIEAVRLMRDVPAVRESWRQKFRHILVDEYQDTNAAQYALIRLLVNDERNICVVGDDWQSIYSWRGADYTNILNFERDFPGTTVIKLEQNYRSTQAILDAAHAVIVKNDDRTDKQLWTESQGGAPVEVHSVYDETEEAYRVAERIASQVGLKARRYDDFAILYRTNAQSYTLERALMQQRIPYQIVGGIRFYDRREVKDLLAYLRLLYQPRDTVSFLRIANVPTRGIGAVSLDKFTRWVAETGQDIITGLEGVALAPLTPRARTALMSLGMMLRSLQQELQADESPAVLLEHILERTDYLTMLRDGSDEGEEREANLSALVSDARSFASIDDFLEEASLMSSADEQQRDATVTLMTLHAAKGLEFPVVWMVGLEEGLLPHARVFDGTPADLEEERRLCYVGMTRAREELHLSYAARRMQFGQTTYGQPSRFLEDIGHHADHFSLQSTMTSESDIDPIMPFDIGDQVRSMQFGDGEVIDIDGLAATVAFTSGTTKKLNVEYARLQKLA